MIFINKTRNISNLNKFQDEVISLIPKIICVIKFNDDDLRFALSENLSVEEDQALDGFVIDFEDNNIELQMPKILSIAKAQAKSKHFHTINYKHEDLEISLIPKRTVVKGEVIKVEWYKSLDQDNNPIDLVLKVDITYSRDSAGFATERTTTRTWINEDESENEEVKVTKKYYFINPADTIDEGLKRRKLLVNNMQIPVMTFMTEVLVPDGYTPEAVIFLGRAFLDDYENDFNKFVDNSSTITDPASSDFGKKSIVVQLEDSASDGRNAAYNFWLDRAPASLGGLTTIRQYLIEEFSI